MEHVWNQRSQMEVPIPSKILEGETRNGNKINHFKPPYEIEIIFRTNIQRKIINDRRRNQPNKTKTT